MIKFMPSRAGTKPEITLEGDRHMTHEEIKATLFLNAVLADIEPLVEIDERAAALVRGWNNTIQFQVENGGPAAYLQFSNGKPKLIAGRSGNPTILFSFDTIAQLIDMMDGKGKPKIKKGMIRIFTLLKFQKLTQIMEKTLKPDASALKDPAALKRTLTLTMNTALNGIKIIAENDPHIEATAAHLGTGTAQFSVLPDGPHGYVTVVDNKITPAMGKLNDATVYMEFRTPEIAMQVFNGELDSMAAIGVCDIVLRGFYPLAGALSTIMGRIEHFLQ